MSDQTQIIRDTGSTPVRGSKELLKETLKRCSSKTLEAALEYRETGNVSLVPTVVLGIIERFLDPDLGEKLQGGDDSIRLMDDLGIDSLDMIEAIMMVEETVGVSIKNEELVNLRTVGELNRFIEAKITGIRAPASAKFFPMEEVAATLPQQNPFMFVQEATIDGAEAQGKYSISGKEAFLEGHFKGNPVFPASIMLEALGQLAVFQLLKQPPTELENVHAENSEIYFIGADGVRCHRVCKPGDVLELEVKLKRVREPLAVFTGSIIVGGEKAVVAQEITLAINSVSDQPKGTNGVKANGSH